MPTTKKSSHTLSAEERNEMSDSTYAFPKERKEPLNNASHVRNAIARFDQVKGVSTAQKKTATETMATVWRVASRNAGSSSSRLFMVGQSPRSAFDGAPWACFQGKRHEPSACA